MMMSGFLLPAVCSSCRAREAAFDDEVVVNSEHMIGLMHYGA
jgi:hypothetical protein